MHGGEYGALLEHMSRLGALPLGLLRAPAAGNALPCVLTNPPASTRIAPDDCVLAVGIPASASGGR